MVEVGMEREPVAQQERNGRGGREVDAILQESGERRVDPFLERNASLGAETEVDLVGDVLSESEFQDAARHGVVAERGSDAESRRNAPAAEGFSFRGGRAFRGFAAGGTDGFLGDFLHFV